MTDTENADFLRRELVRALLEERPRSVLDVGCGAGVLLGFLAAAGVPATGVEFDPQRLATADAASPLRGRSVCARAERLPFGDRAFDWGVLRHVLHHLEDGYAAVRELARVVRTGVILAEPWRDPERPLQQTGLRLDDWMRRQDRRLGRVHGPDTPEAKLLAWTRPDFGRVRVERHLRPSRAAHGEVCRDIELRLSGLPEEHPDRVAAKNLLEHIEREGVERSGSVLVVAGRSVVG